MHMWVLIGSAPHGLVCTHTGHWNLDEGEGGRGGAVVPRQMGVETGGASVVLGSIEPLSTPPRG